VTATESAAGGVTSRDAPRVVRWAVVSVALLAALVARLMLFVGVKRLDSFRYLEISHHVLSGGSLFDPTVTQWPRRLALILPLVASNRIGGYGQHVSAAWPLLCSLGSVLVVYLLGKELWNWRIGALAAFGMALYPLEIELGTQVLPDPVAGFFIVVAVYLAVLAVKRDRGSVAYAIASGAALGIVFYTRENALVFLPGLVAVGALLDPKRWKRTLWAPLGVVAVVVAAMAYFWIAFGNPVIDWVRFVQFYSAYRTTGFVQPATTYLHDFLTQPAFAAFPVVVVLAIVGAALSTGRGRWLLLTWALGFYLVIGVIGPIVGMDVSYRYAEPIVPPLILLAAAGVAALGRRFRAGAEGPTMIGAGLALLLLLPSAQAAVRLRTDNARWASIERAWRIASRVPDAYLFVDDAWVFTVINYDSGFTLGRDSLAPADAPVNDKARLFKTSERSIPAIQTGFLVIVNDPPPDVAVREKADLWYGSDKRLRVFEFGPGAVP
jgi:4-amino-4-deoxy-L-arabinose transferase-like glycosyltransferase